MTANTTGRTSFLTSCFPNRCEASLGVSVVNGAEHTKAAAENLGFVPTRGYPSPAKRKARIDTRMASGLETKMPSAQKHFLARLKLTHKLLLFWLLTAALLVVGWTWRPAPVAGDGPGIDP